MPFLSGFVFKKLDFRSIPSKLALAQLRGAPGQAMVSLAAIVASFSLMVAMAIMVASFRTSVDDWLGAVLPADLYFRTAQAGETAWLDPALEQQVRALPQVERAVFLRSTRISLRPSSPQVALIARDGMETRFPLVGKAYERKAGDPPAARRATARCRNHPARAAECGRRRGSLHAVAAAPRSGCAAAAAPA